MHKYKLRQVPRFFGTNWCAIVVPIQVIRWYRQCYNGTDSCAIVVQIRRYCHYRLSCLQRCISFESYIKPQLSEGFLDSRKCCISFESYIKPQRERCPGTYRWVVYLLNPTSNHNIFGTHYAQAAVVYLLNPTSNHNSTWITSFSMLLYIFWILHQTTTLPSLVNALSRCISFESYIKPQPHACKFSGFCVVYLLNPTSNHNPNSAI